ncbi:MAG: isoleucine--tRNA ligase [Deltaproteobacteria bacterium]|nr:isoleucine--tRNA ligase [Deltaproteobacteria bacterium]MBN2670429.1 isoleucine--tRNA ligase [Deltaproteobacteria bacterium]
MSDDYKKSICLPKTQFPMKAGLAKREPEFLQFWQENDIYAKMLKQNEDGEKFIFHDGPPYANGTIHHGHILNKVLKDIVVKYRMLKGNYVRYIPGWDCHGLPIELNAEKELGKPKDSDDKLSIRKRCEEFAMKWSTTQMDEMKRLGVFSDWEHPYRTIQPKYEEAIAEQLAAIVDKDMLYRGSKPVYWCSQCTTALAEAEVEYMDHASPSIYVRYEAIDREKLLHICGLEDDGKPLSVVIWTTTPWTLPASLVIAVHPRYNYRAFQVGEEYVVLAEDMAETAFKASELEYRAVGTAFAGAELEKLTCRHPFIEDRVIPILLAEYVTLEAGTGCVHTAPGHGQDDYVLCAAHGIEPYAPVDEKGRFEKEVEKWQGMQVTEANPHIVKHLGEIGRLLNPVGQKISHQYPCCWRCKTPVIFRSTAQWFISMDKTGLREQALKEIDATRWIPPWGRDRIRGMVEDRPDWCISRQRLWGVPLPFFFCNDCDESLVDGDVVRHVAKIFGEHGSDEWFKREPKDLLPEGTKCSCGCTEFEKDENIVDVWFESGVSWAAVAAQREGLGVPTDLYLEGSDQHRGWFHTSLLTSVATTGKAPYKAVLTHGFICNEQGKKYSKSQKNFVPPAKTINAQGAEILRMWVGYEDYRSDIVYSPKIITALTDSYRKIRNTLRFMLGNTDGFNPETDMVAISDMPELDRWMLARFHQYLQRLDRAYAEYNFHLIFHRTVELVTSDLSSFYLDIIKDRLYCEQPTGTLRRAAQTVLYIMARDMSRILSPVLSFTAEEVWQHLPGRDSAAESVFLSGFPTADEAWKNEELLERWSRLREVRREVTKVLEEMRRDGKIGNALQANVEVTASSTTYDLLAEMGDEMLTDVFLVSKCTLTRGTGETTVEAKANEEEKCPRCWRMGHGVGSDSERPELCGRCAEVVRELVASGQFGADDE